MLVDGTLRQNFFLGTLLKVFFPKHMSEESVFF